MVKTYFQNKIVHKAQIWNLYLNFQVVICLANFHIIVFISDVNNEHNMNLSIM